MKTIDTPTPRYRVFIILEVDTEDGDTDIVASKYLYASHNRIAAERRFELIAALAHPTATDNGIPDAVL